MTTSRRTTKGTTARSTPAQTTTPAAEQSVLSTTTRGRSITVGWVAKVVITVVALVAVAYVAWLLVTSAGLGSFPAPADTASDAAKVGSFMIRFGLVIIALAVAVLLGTQILSLLLPERPVTRGSMNWVEFMKALGELIKTPAGIGFGVVILGVILMFPTVFATTP